MLHQTSVTVARDLIKTAVVQWISGTGYGTDDFRLECRVGGTSGLALDECCMVLLQLQRSETSGSTTHSSPLWAWSNPSSSVETKRIIIPYASVPYPPRVWGQVKEEPHTPKDCNHNRLTGTMGHQSQWKQSDTSPPQAQGYHGNHKDLPRIMIPSNPTRTISIPQ